MNPARFSNGRQGKACSLGKSWGLGDVHTMHDQLFFVERGEGTGPGLEAAPAVLQLDGRARGKVHQAVFTLQDRSERCSRVILRPRLNARVGETGQRHPNERRAGQRQLLEEIDGGLLRRDGEGTLQKNRPRVETLFEQHRRIAGEDLAVGHGPLDRRGAAIARQ